LDAIFAYEKARLHAIDALLKARLDAIAAFSPEKKASWNLFNRIRREKSPGNDSHSGPMFVPDFSE
jgi:hypothetical protein